MIDLSNVLEIIFSWLRKALYASALVTFFSIIAFTVTGFVATMLLVFGYVQDFLTMAMCGNSGVSAVFGMLNCIGFTQAFNDYKTYIIASIVFYFVRILLAQIISLYFKVFMALQPLVLK